MENVSLHEKIISGMCRLCLSCDGALIDMFSFSSELESKIADAVTKCTSVHVEKHSKLPATICEFCYMQLIKTQNFQTRAHKSDKILQVYLQQLQVDGEQSILGSSVILPDIDASSSIETNVANPEEENNSTYYGEIKRDVRYSESGCEEHEMDIVEDKVFALDSKSHTEWIGLSSKKDTAFNPNLIVKTEPIINDKEDQFAIDTEIETKIKLENEVSSDTIMTSCQCDVCNECFSSSNELRKHKRIHTNEKPFKCNLCSKSFTLSNYLKNHKRTHTGEKPYQCDVCNKCFTVSATLRRHQRVHTGEKPYQCDVCKKCFNELCHLKTHQRQHTGEKPHKCDVCNKCFNQSGTLRIHQRVHTGEKPYQCDVCNKSFSISVTLRRHRRVHTGEKPYKCDVCNKSFREFGHLKAHQRGLHTGEKPHKCNVCNKCFSESGTLRKHQRVHNAEIPNRVP